MIKIKCLSNAAFVALKKAFKESSPVKSAEKVLEPFFDSYDVLISDDVLLMRARDEVIIYYMGRLFRMSIYAFLSIEIG